MRISEVKVKLMNSRNDKLRAFCSITIDDNFVVRDLKIIEGAKGAFVAMPTRKLTARCPHCSGKNHLKARYCNDCGRPLNFGRFQRNGRGPLKLHTDIAHPINSECRDLIQNKVLEAYELEKERSKQSDYIPIEIYTSCEEFDGDKEFEEGIFI